MVAAPVAHISEPLRNCFVLWKRGSGDIRVLDGSSDERHRVALAEISHTKMILNYRHIRNQSAVHIRRSPPLPIRNARRVI
ncbi:hypothetical protein ACLB2K_046763 [Fragaria x ananassa]